MYAKDYFAETKLISDPGLCFVLMPFAPGFDETWTVIRNTIGGRPFNLLCKRADDIDRPGYVMTDVLENIGRARLIIADLSDQNGNVFYELGIAHSVKEASQVILISKNMESIPFDLRQLRCINYEGSYEKLKAMLSDTITDLAIRQYDLELKEGETKKFATRLTGDDNCLYEVDIFAEYIADDGVKFRIDLTKYVGGKEPKKFLSEYNYLGERQPHMKVPEIPWSICYSRKNDKQVRFILGRPHGWQQK